MIKAFLGRRRFFVRKNGHFVDEMIGGLLPFCSIGGAFGTEMKDGFVIEVFGIGCLRFFDDLIQLIWVFQQRAGPKGVIAEWIMPMKRLHERAAQRFD